MADPSTSPRLTILGGPLSGRELTLDEAVDNILIGSDSSCRFHLDHPGVSPIHARLWVDWQGVTVYDTGAPEGVYLNDDRVPRSAPVRNGDILWLGPPGGDGVVMIQCRVPPRVGAPTAVPLPVVAPADAGATLVASAPDAPVEPFTATVAFATPDETLALSGQGAAGAEPETVWLTPDAIEESAAEDEPATDEPVFAERPPAYVEPFDATAIEDDFAAATVVLHSEEAAPLASADPPGAEQEISATDAALPPSATSLRGAAGFTPDAQRGGAWGDDAVLPSATSLRGAAGFTPDAQRGGSGGDDAVPPSSMESFKFELDQTPPVLASAPPVFEDDIEEPQTEPIEATVVMDGPPEWEPPATVVVPPAAAPVATQPEIAPPLPVAPAPAAAPETAPAPVAPPATSVPRPIPTPAKRAAGGSSAGRWIGLAAVALLLVGGGLFAVYRFVLSPSAPTSPAPPDTAAAPPMTLAQASTPALEPSLAPTQPMATPPTEESVTIVTQPAAGAPTPKPTPTPRGVPSAAPTARATIATPPVAPVDPRAQALAQAAALAAQGDAALGEKRHDAALLAYNQALQLDPQNTQASGGRARAQAAAAEARRTFVAGRSVLIGARSGKKGPAGFDAEDVEVAKSPDYSGRIEFEAGQRSVNAGDAWSVRVFLVNDGKKDFKIQSLSASASVNGSKAPVPAGAGVREVATQKRAQIAELSGTWKEGTTAWSLDVSVTSAHGEVVRNTLSWR